MVIEREMHAYNIHEKDGKKYWTRVGTAHRRSDGSIGVQLVALPVNGALELRDARKGPHPANEVRALAERVVAMMQRKHHDLGTVAFQTDPGRTLCESVEMLMHEAGVIVLAPPTREAEEIEPLGGPGDLEDRLDRALKAADIESQTAPTKPRTRKPR